MDPVTGSIISAAIGPLLGGIFGGNKQKNSSRVDLKALVKDAKASGFNPVTALGAVGNSYAQTDSTTFNSGEFIASAVGAGVDAYFNYDPDAQERKDLDLQIQRQSLENMRADPYAFSGINQTPYTSNSGAVSVEPEFLGSTPHNAQTRPPSRFSYGSELIPIYGPDGQPWQIPRRVADASNLVAGGYMTAGQFTELRGEIVGEFEVAVNAAEIAKAVNADTLEFGPYPNPNPTIVNPTPNAVPSTGFFGYFNGAFPDGVGPLN
jgi:hypothetical protein